MRDWLIVIFLNNQKINKNTTPSEIQFYIICRHVSAFSHWETGCVFFNHISQKIITQTIIVTVSLKTLQQMYKNRVGCKMIFLRFLFWTHDSQWHVFCRVVSVKKKSHQVVYVVCKIDRWMKIYSRLKTFELQHFHCTLLSLIFWT